VKRKKMKQQRTPSVSENKMIPRPKIIIIEEFKKKNRDRR